MVLSEMDAGKALTAAAARGNSGEVQRILEECRVHPDTVNEFGRTALQVRAKCQKCFIIHMYCGFSRLILCLCVCLYQIVPEFRTRTSKSRFLYWIHDETVAYAVNIIY